MCLEIRCNIVKTISYPFLLKFLIRLQNIQYLLNQISTTNTKLKSAK